MKLIVLDPHGGTALETELNSSNELSEAIIESPECHIRFGCRNGRCGACLVKTDRPEAFLDPSPREKLTLQSVAARPDERLACVCEPDLRVSGTVRVWNAFSVYNPVKR